MLVETLPLNPLVGLRRMFDARMKQPFFREGVGIGNFPQIDGNEAGARFIGLSQEEKQDKGRANHHVFRRIRPHLRAARHEAVLLATIL
jgi:hypothetical protein